MTSPAPADGEVTPGPASSTAAKNRLPANQTVVDDDLDAVVAAVNAMIRRWKTPPVDPAPWGDDVVLGSNMLAARLYMRRNSPAGVLTFGDQGSAYVQRNDPDVAMLLQLGSYAPPVVG